ncbi:MAG: leucine-rich repeat domain-containing protein [Chitinophagales bacterium]
MKKSIITALSLILMSAAYAQLPVYTSMEEALKEPEKVRALTLKELGLTELPGDIEKFTNLEVLDLSGNRLTQFPEKLFSFKKLRALTLKGNRIERLPEDIHKMDQLEELYISYGLSHNVPYEEFKTIPASFGQLNHLRVLDVSDWNLFSLPESVSKLGLEELYASNNHIQSLPEELFTRGRLKVVDLSNNNLTALPANLDVCGNLGVLNVSGNQIKNLPEAITNLQNLRYLNLAGNKFIKPVIEIKRLIPLNNLAYLNLSNTGVTELPTAIGTWGVLQEFDISNNNLKALPTTIGSLKNLEKLNISHNNIIALPKTFYQLSSLKQFNAGYNAISSLEDFSSGTPFLQSVDFSHNQDLALCPNSFSKMESLKVVNVKHTGINRFQAERLMNESVSAAFIY